MISESAEARGKQSRHPSPTPPNDVSVHSDSRLVGGPDISKDSDGVSSSSSGRAQLSEAPGGEAHGKCAASS